MDTSLISSLFSNIWSIFLIILFFGGSIFIHELGHFLAARRRGLVVERFSIGFGPRILTWKRNGVEYCISLLPLGGYVLIPQLADMQAVEGKSKFAKDNLPPITFTDKFIVSIMGVVFNLIFAFILASILWFVGIPSTEDEQTTIIGYIQPTLYIAADKKEVKSPALEADLQIGDRILSVDGIKVNSFNDIRKTVVTGSNRSNDNEPTAYFEIERNGQQKEITVHPVVISSKSNPSDAFRIIGVGPMHTIALSHDPAPETPAYNAGMRKGDKVIAINHEKLYSSAQLYDILQNNANKPVTITLLRNGQTLDITLTPENRDISKPLAFLGTDSAQESADEESLTGPAITFIPSASYKALVSPKGNQVYTHFFVFPISDLTHLPNIQAGDRLVGANALEINSFDTFLQAFNDPGRTAHTLSLLRNNERFDINIPITYKASVLPPRKQAMIGIEKILSRELVTVYINPFTQFKDNILMTFRVLGSLISPKSDVHLEQLMGPPGIARAFHAFSNQDIRLVLWFTVLLNINLAIINILPLPVLDGGHILFALIAKIRNKALPVRLIANIQAMFMILLFGLMIYVSFFDVMRWKSDNQFQKQQEQLRYYYVDAEAK